MWHKDKKTAQTKLQKNNIGKESIGQNVLIIHQLIKDVLSKKYTTQTSKNNLNVQHNQSHILSQIHLKSYNSTLW